MKEVLEALKTLQLSQAQLASNVDAISGRVNVLAGMKEVRDVAGAESSTAPRKEVDSISSIEESQEIKIPESPSLPLHKLIAKFLTLEHQVVEPQESFSRELLLSIFEVKIGTDESSTYPGQSGINPLPMDWGNKDPQERGPVVVSRTQSTLRRRNGEDSFTLFHNSC